jgi:hypothetical protein
MDELDTPLTEIEQSRAVTGFRYYVVDPTVYDALSTAVDQSRGYPWRYTERGLPLVDSLPDASDGSGRKLIAIDSWRFTTADDEMLEGPLQAGTCEELTYLEYIALKPADTNTLEE